MKYQPVTAVMIELTSFRKSFDGEVVQINLQTFKNGLLASLVSTSGVKNGIRTFIDNKSESLTLSGSIRQLYGQRSRSVGSGVVITASHSHIAIPIISYSCSD